MPLSVPSAYRSPERQLPHRSVSPPQRCPRRNEPQILVDRNPLERESGCEYRRDANLRGARPGPATEAWGRPRPAKIPSAVQKTSVPGHTHKGWHALCDTTEYTSCNDRSAALFASKGTDGRPNRKSGLPQRPERMNNRIVFGARGPQPAHPLESFLSPLAQLY